MNNDKVFEMIFNRLGEIENKIDKLQNFKFQVIGSASVIVLAITLGLRYFK